MGVEPLPDYLPGVVSDVLSRRAAEKNPGATIRAAKLEEILDLRYQVLRAGLPRDAAKFEGDTVPTARHYGAFLDGRNVGCATLHLNQWHDEPAWQLRGMAVTPEAQHKGIGRAILTFLEADILATHPVHLLWCNARVPAIRFYQQSQWQMVSEEFDIPTAGPHVRMVKRLTP